MPFVRSPYVAGKSIYNLNQPFIIFKTELASSNGASNAYGRSTNYSLKLITSFIYNILSYYSNWYSQVYYIWHFVSLNWFEKIFFHYQDKSRLLTTFTSGNSRALLMNVCQLNSLRTKRSTFQNSLVYKVSIRNQNRAKFSKNMNDHNLNYVLCFLLNIFSE